MLEVHRTTIRSFIHCSQVYMFIYLDSDCFVNKKEMIQQMNIYRSILERVAQIALTAIGERSWCA